MKIKSKLILLISFILLSIFLWKGFEFLQKEDDTAIHIAFVGPMSGENAKVGQSMSQAIQLYLDKINQQGGINHQKIVLDIFDDQNNPYQATKVAKDIVKQNLAVAVIGHHYSSCSINGGKIYKGEGIPAITPASTLIDVTQDNNWYFRTIFNDKSQTSFLAHYAKRILHKNTVSIIHTNDPYGSSLAGLFEKASKDLIDIKHKWSFSSANLEQEIATIVSDLQSQSDSSLIFLATHASEGVQLVKLLRDAGITNSFIVPDSYAGKTFSEGFSNYPNEKLNPGYYTNDIYVSTPFILDTANKQADTFNRIYQKQYHEKPSWHAFYAVDAAMVLIEAIKQAKIQGKYLAIDREKIRNVLSNKFQTAEQAVKGNTGLNYFDNNGDAFKFVSMGVYKNNHIISALEQLQAIPQSPSQIKKLDSAIEKERIFLINNQYLYKTDVVYTGIDLNNISNFDSKTGTYSMDFYLWFRFKGKLNPENIEFLNAVEPIKLGTPIVNETHGKKTYQLYRITGNFKTNNSIADVSLIKNQLGFSFRHRELDRNHLIYVTDILGMELTKATSLADKLKEFQSVNSLADWKIEEVDFYQGIVKQKLLGNPEYIVSRNTAEYSTFNVNLLIGNNAYVYHRMVPFKFLLAFFVFSAVISLLLLLVSYKDKTVEHLKYVWFFQIIFAFLLLISTELFIIRWQIDQPIHNISIESIVTIFQILWWIILAIFLNTAVERFLWLPLEEKTERRVPNLMRFVTALIIYLFVLFGIIAFVLDRPITSLLATSGVVAMIIGLAVQMNLSHVFSGIALNLERSLRIGDWVKIGSFDEGIVVNMNWRVTQIKTRRGYILNIPNSTVSNSDIHNFSYPDDQYWLLVRVPIEPKHDPRKVEKILLNAVLSVEQGVVKDVKPGIWLENIQVGSVNNEFVASYVIFFKTENYQRKFVVLKSVWTNIWISLNKANILPANLQEEEEQKTAPEVEEISFTTPEFEKVLNKNNFHEML